MSIISRMINDIEKKNELLKKRDKVIPENSIEYKSMYKKYWNNNSKIDTLNELTKEIERLQEIITKKFPKSDEKEALYLKGKIDGLMLIWTPKPDNERLNLKETEVEMSKLAQLEWNKRVNLILAEYERRQMKKQLIIDRNQKKKVKE